MNPTWTTWHTVALVAIAAAVGVVGWYSTPSWRSGGWILTMVLLAIFVLVAGHGVNGRLSGVLVDERNRMSLSRLQMILWTIVILAGYLVGALGNVRLKAADPLSIAIPGEIWAILGISTASLVGSPLLRSSKKTKPANTQEAAQTFNLLRDQGLDIGQLGVQGQVVVAASPNQASFGDLFRGEETGNAAVLDVGKIQMFFFTLALVLAYAVGIGQLINTVPVVTEFPELGQGMVTLLGISHAGYLVNKGVPHSTS